jgi:hypothetical protein
MAVAKRILPQIGEGKVVDVMDYVLTCVAKGLSHVSEKQIAEDLDLSQSTVHVLLWRGWNRLERAARAEGVVFEGFGLHVLQPTVEEDLYQDEEDA